MSELIKMIPISNKKRLKKNQINQIYQIIIFYQKMDLCQNKYLQNYQNLKLILFLMFKKEEDMQVNLFLVEVDLDEMMALMEKNKEKNKKNYNILNIDLVYHNGNIMVEST
ncbi:unnamed protein product [Paramecium sonneborni]|uniref:Uncharacterized protein n=1 Tax=Paramecium sonneborni TaxID=65129 RepID=A0A8S1LY87_9CILI|nr:unnamed protein product [Paramecium sonneborni]